MAVRREYSKIAGVESVDTMLDGATVKLRGQNKAVIEQFWMIADRLGTEPTQAKVLVAGRISHEDGRYWLAVTGTKRRYAVSANAQIEKGLSALIGEAVVAEVERTVHAQQKVAVRLRRVPILAAAEQAAAQ